MFKLIHYYTHVSSCENLHFFKSWTVRMSKLELNFRCFGCGAGGRSGHPWECQGAGEESVVFL